MYKRILVGLDDGETAEALFERAVTLAQVSDASLLLMSVLVPPDYLQSPMAFPAEGAEESDSYIGVDESVWSVYQSLYKNYELRDLKRLETFLERANAAGVTAEISQRSGSPGRAICDRAKDWKADLIMVGSHGRTGISEMMLGSVSNHVTHHAGCSVLVVHDLVISHRDERALSPVR